MSQAPDIWGEFQAEVGRARAVVASYEAQELLDDDAAEQLQRDALSGRLGAGMQQIAERVAAGEVTWEQVFRDQTPYTALLQEHVGRMAEEHAAAIALGLQEDPDVDDLGPPSGPAAGAGSR